MVKTTRTRGKIRTAIDSLLSRAWPIDDDFSLIEENHAKRRSRPILLDNPSITYDELIFPSGTSLKIKSNDIVVFVGPNNAGKSAILREVAGPFIGRSFARTVTKSAQIKKHDTLKDFKRRMELVSRVEQNLEGKKRYIGLGFSVSEAEVERIWVDDFFGGANIFCRYIDTESRLIGSNPTRSFDAIRRAPENAIQAIYCDEAVETQVAYYFKQSFSKDLVVDRLAGEKIGLLVGERPEVQAGEDRLSISYNQRLRKQSSPLESQGDGMRSFVTVMLAVLVGQTAGMLLIDEPEAFLHPPQARLLGELIARESPRNSQIFVATHSSDVLLGLLSASPGRLRIVRLQRSGNTNDIKELDSGSIDAMSSDPLSTFSSLLNGLFYPRVVIGESDSDCTFYQGLLRSTHPAAHSSDVLFMHANGKDRMTILASSLRRLGVPYDVIADLDVMQDAGGFRRLVEAVGGTWSDFERDHGVVKRSIDQMKPRFNSNAIRQQIQDVLTTVQTNVEFPNEAKRRIDDVLRQTSPWSALKAAGKSAIAPGDASAAFETLRKRASNKGLWLVPSGELEGFCRSVGGHGPRWVQQVMQTRDLLTADDLAEARAFMKEITETWTQ
ncbi:MAG: AAA family ATPase [Rhizobiaceae bacterium]|nr:AAA family ATPase [Rhizobiaceae bacterium]